MVYNIGKIYDTYVKDRQQTNLEGTAKEAEELISSSIESNSLAIVQGPPGTGKTTLYYNVIENSLDNLDENEVIVYTAPSNRLVADMLKRICKLFPDKKNFREKVRVYGSQFDYTGFESLRGQITKNVKLVITTDYQRIFFSREFKSQDYLSRFHMLIDEASRSPLHREFTPIAEELLRNGKQILGSLNVIGDPMQAISLTEFYRISRREYLLMEKILMKLMEHDYPDIYKNIINNKISLMDAVYKNPPKSFYKFLDTTRRLPIPTQEIISYAYYGGLLKSAVDGKKVIKEINHSYDRGTLNRLKNEQEIREFAKNVEDVITTERIGIYHHVRQKFAYNDPEDLYDDIRAKIAASYAIIVSAVTKNHTTIISPYVDMSIQTKLLISNLINKYDLKGLNELIDVTTVQSMLGGEDYNIIAILGKEYTAQSYDEPLYTIYFNEPELLNVQFSRHKGIFIVVGNLGRLRTTARKLHKDEIKTVAEEVARLSRIKFVGERKSDIKKDNDPHDAELLFVDNI